MKKALAGFYALKLDRLFYRLWRYNPIALVRLYGHHAFDRRFGVLTRGYSDLRYEPTPVSAFEQFVKALREEEANLDDFVFVDVGSGKGKAVLLASNYPFKKVVGVERYEEFHQTALKNIGKFSKSKCQCESIELECIDAAYYSWPIEPLILYFFNPFSVDILKQVLSNIEVSIEKHPRPLYIIYYAPIIFRGSPWDRRRLFDESKHLMVVKAENDFTLYRSSYREADEKIL